MFRALLAACTGLLLLFLAAPAVAERARLPAEFSRLLTRADVQPSAVSVLVSPLPDHTAASTSAAPKAPTRPAKPAPARLAYRADASMNPASVMKLVTTYAALELLGPDFTWRNQVYVDGAVHEGVLHGNLVLRGSGDPKLVHERLDALLAQVLALGLREVRGDIVLDASVFDLPAHNPAEFDDEPLRPYNAAPEGLLINFKALLLRFTPDAATARARLHSEPLLAGLDLPSDVALANGPCGDWRSGLRADFSDPQRVRFAGRYPRSCGERVWPVAYADPASYAPRVVQAAWAAAGGTLAGRVRWGATPASAQLWTSAPSLALADIVADINKFSNNVMAQQLFLSLSSAAVLTAGPAGEPPLGSPPSLAPQRASFEASRQRLGQWWAAHLAGQAAPVLDNGSGLSRRERISASALAALLARANAGPLAAPFAASLAIAGVDGTVARMNGGSAGLQALGNAQLKTGSLRDVSALAGYVNGQSGQRYSVVVLVNHPHAGAAKPALEWLIQWVARDGT